MTGEHRLTRGSKTHKLSVTKRFQGKRVLKEIRKKGTRGHRHKDDESRAVNTTARQSDEARRDGWTGARRETGSVQTH